MHNGRRAARSLAALLAMSAGLLTSVQAATVTAATAAEVALARHSTAVSTTSGVWAALPTTAASAPYVPTALALTFAVAVTTPRPQYFWVVNTGTVSLTGASYTVTETGALGLTATVQACVGGSWNETTDACSGTITTVATSGAGATSSTVVPGAPSAQVRLRALLSGAPTVTVAVVTTSISVARTDARAATTTYS
ncbi:MAG: hypothetical protein QOC82_1810 [Frankiaceae bacterium]|nr:hypothetical protein [Frankiaceae bacterium]